MPRPKRTTLLPFWQEGLQFECQSSGNCCASRGEYGFVYLTDEDEVRLAAHLGLVLEDFRTLHTDVTGGYRHLKDPDRDCMFLRERRCDVYEARPSQCRTWPFWPENLKSTRAWQREVVKMCPGVGQGRVHSAKEIQAVLDSQPEE